MPEPVVGFSQTHVSGTGGGQKYGNVLIMPYLTSNLQFPPSFLPLSLFSQCRTSETIAIGYYATTFENGIRTEITTSARCAHYRFHYPSPTPQHPKSDAHLFIDATHFLGKDTIPNLRERQQFVGAELTIISDNEVEGYTCVRGGWNNGDAYTVYFAIHTDKPFSATTDSASQRAFLNFTDSLVGVKVGISYISALQAHKNIDSIAFDDQLSLLRQTWEEQLAKVDIEGTEQQKRMFYTALYHTMLMPVDKTGENPRWTAAPYYDDYYAIWDTYRTSSPLLTLLDEQREADIVNSLLNIYRYEGYMPDARSGDCNGRTQGGSNAEVVIADAFVKGLKGIDYTLALDAMLKDAEADPGADHEKHGRGGLDDYRRLGYIPYGVPRAGTRTVEYAFCDYCVAVVARGLGRHDLYDKYLQRSRNWRNLWRTDYEFDSMRGYIMPKDADGQWLDSVPWGHSQVFHPRIPYTPVTKVAPWYVPWWDTFFYEATSQEYSLSMPHDVEGLIDACGGPAAFRQRLDRFFERGYYNVQNEPSFLTPCLYHWINRPDLSTQRIRQIISDNYSDLPDGLPGNDDSGAMSSWLAFHMLGLYPNAGHDYYLLTLPLVDSYVFTLPNGRWLHARKEQGDSLTVIFNGHALTDARIRHADLLQGGTLVFKAPSKLPSPQTTTIRFTLNRQFRTWPFSYEWLGDTLQVTCKETTYRIPRRVADTSDKFCWLSPQTDGTVYHDVAGTFCFISCRAFQQLATSGLFTYDNITWRLIDQTSEAFHVQADADGTEMWIANDARLPFVILMKNNPLGIDWKLSTPSSIYPSR